MHSDAGCERAKSVHEDCSAHRRPASRRGESLGRPRRAWAERAIGGHGASTGPLAGPLVHRRRAAAHVARGPRDGATIGRMRSARVPSCPVLVLGLARALPRARGGRPTEPVGVWPLEPEPEVVRGFEPPPSPTPPGHRGVDLAGAPGQAVLAALPGTVGFAGSIGGKPVVTVLHGGRRTTYEPVVGLGRARPAGRGRRRARAPRAHRQPLLPRAPACTGADRGHRDDEEYARPADAGRRRAGAAAAAVARRAGHRRLPVDSPAASGGGVRSTGWPERPAAGVVDRGLARLRPAGGPAGRPGAAGRW